MKYIIDVAYSMITHIGVFFAGLLFGFTMREAGMTFLFGMVTGGSVIALLIGTLSEEVFHRKSKEQS